MDYITKHIRENPLQWIIQGVAVLVVIANVFIAFKLAPVASNLENLTGRVSANEEDLAELTPLSTDVAVIKVNVLDIKEDLKDIKDYLNVR